MNLCFSPPKKDSCHESSIFDGFWSDFGGSERGRGSIPAPFREIVEDLGSVCLDFAAILHGICNFWAFSWILGIFFGSFAFWAYFDTFLGHFCIFRACLCVFAIFSMYVDILDVLLWSQKQNHWKDSCMNLSFVMLFFLGDVSFLLVQIPPSNVSLQQLSSALIPFRLMAVPCRLHARELLVTHVIKC